MLHADVPTGKRDFSARQARLEGNALVFSLLAVMGCRKASVANDPAENPPRGGVEGAKEVDINDPVFNELPGQTPGTGVNTYGAQGVAETLVGTDVSDVLADSTIYKQELTATKGTTTQDGTTYNWVEFTANTDGGSLIPIHLLGLADQSIAQVVHVDAGGFETPIFVSEIDGNSNTIELSRLSAWWAFGPLESAAKIRVVSAVELSFSEVTLWSVKSDNALNSASDDDISGGAGNDYIVTTGGANVVDAGDGADWVNAIHGNDRIALGAGDDDVSSGSGVDMILGGAGFDEYWFGTGYDQNFLIEQAESSDSDDGTAHTRIFLRSDLALESTQNWKTWVHWLPAAPYGVTIKVALDVFAASGHSTMDVLDDNADSSGKLGLEASLKNDLLVLLRPEDSMYYPEFEPNDLLADDDWVLIKDFFDPASSGSFDFVTQGGAVLKPSLTGTSANETLSFTDGIFAYNGRFGHDTLSFAASDVRISAALDRGDDTALPEQSAIPELLRIGAIRSITEGQPSSITTDIGEIRQFESLTGSAYADILSGNSERNTLDGGGGDDVLYGGDLHDWLIGGAGNDRIDGGGDGKDLDIVDYSYLKHALVLAIPGKNETVSVTINDADKDILEDVEGVISGSYADYLTGSDNGNLISGGGGVDIIHGGAGGDYIYDGKVGYSLATHKTTGIDADTGRYYVNIYYDQAIFPIYYGYTGHDKIIENYSIVRNAEGEDHYQLSTIRNIDSDVSTQEYFSQSSAVWSTRPGVFPQIGVRLESDDADIWELDYASAFGFHQEAADIEYAETGKDEIHGNGGSDNIVTVGSDNRIFAGEGNDWVGAGIGDDYIDLGAGNDRSRPGGGNDLIFAGKGADSVGSSWGEGHDILIETPEAGVDNTYTISLARGLVVESDIRWFRGDWLLDDAFVNEHKEHLMDDDDVNFAKALRDDLILALVPDAYKPMTPGQILGSAEVHWVLLKDYLAFAEDDHNPIINDFVFVQGWTFEPDLDNLI